MFLKQLKVSDHLKGKGEDRHLSLVPEKQFKK